MVGGGHPFYLKFSAKMYYNPYWVGYRLVPKSVTLNDIERRNSLYFALFHRIR